MKNKTLSLIPLLLIVFSFNSCIEIIEHYTFRADGSGSMTIELEMKEIKDLMQQVKNDANMEYNGIKFEKEEAHLKDIEGISNIKSTSDLDSFNFKLYFNFSSIESLNKALEAIYDSKNAEHITYHKKDFIIEHAIPSSFQTAQKEIDPSKREELLSKVKYTLDLTFEKEIKKVVSDGSVRKTKNQVYISASLDSIAKLPDLLHAQIKLK